MNLDITDVNVSFTMHVIVRRVQLETVLVYHMVALNAPVLGDYLALRVTAQTPAQDHLVLMKGHVSLLMDQASVVYVQEDTMDIDVNILIHAIQILVTIKVS